MCGYNFGYYEQIHEEAYEGEKLMIIMDIKVDNLYAFKNFHMNMSYPKKLVDPSIGGEYLEERPNFRYKKVNIIMGGNATGKTSLGKLLMRFVNYFEDGSYHRFVRIIADRSRKACLIIDFITNEECLYRFHMEIASKGEDGKYKDEDVKIHIYRTDINTRDNYETCAKRLDEHDGMEVFYEDLNTSGWCFSYPQDALENKKYLSIEDNDEYLYILERILKTLDPSIKEVIKVKELDHTYAIKLNNQSAVIKDGKITDAEVLSSGTKAGLDISYIIASLMCDKHHLYYCDELFSYVNSDIEKACLSIIIEKLTGRKQLFFTTHNSDVLDMQLPKHSFTFLKKDMDDIDRPITCVNAAELLKRNTDSLKHAVENDLFCTAPELHRLFEIAGL